MRHGFEWRAKAQTSSASEVEEWLRELQEEEDQSLSSLFKSLHHVSLADNEIIRSVTRGGQHAQTVQKENQDAIFQLVHLELLLYR